MFDLPTNENTFCYLYHTTRTHLQALSTILEKGNWNAKKSTIPIPRPGRNDESSSRALFGQGFGENATVNPLSGSARFKVYRRRVIFAIPTRRSHGVCYSPENTGGTIANARSERASCINTLGRSAARTEVQLQPRSPRAMVRDSESDDR